MQSDELTLDAVHIPCHDITLMRHFYTSVLGFAQTRELMPFPDGPQEAWIELKTGRASVVLKPRGTFDGDPRAASMATVHVALRVLTSDEVDTQYDRLVDDGVDFASSPVDWPWNERACFFHDPEGNLIEIFYGAKPHPVRQDESYTQGLNLGILDTVHIPCQHLKTMDAFYKGALGLKQRREMVPFPDGPQDPWPEFETGTTSLVLKPRGPFDGAARLTNMAGCHLGFAAATSSAVDARYERLIADGIGFASPPVDWPWNERACFLHDPEGNLIEIYHGSTSERPSA